MADLQTPDCPLCGETKRDTLYQTGKFAACHVVRCAACRLLYLSPRPSEAQMQALYREDEYFEGDTSGGYASYAAQADALERTFRRLLHTLKQRQMTGGSLLEIGCGYGFLLKQARPFFSLVHATDFSAGALERAQHFADEVFQGGTEALPAPARYDTIIANHVIEHVHDPTAFIAACRDRLNPGGTLLLSTPDAGSFWLRLMGKRWPSFIVPDHLLYFTDRHLRRLFSEHGFSMLQTVPYSHAFPLSLVGQKLGITVPKSIGQWSLWLPKTTVAVAGRLPS